MTPLLKKLESKGYLTRTRCASDERNLIVSVTPAGMALRDKAVIIPEKLARCTNLDPCEAENLYRILCKILYGSHPNDIV